MIETRTRIDVLEVLPVRGLGFKFILYVVEIDKYNWRFTEKLRRLFILKDFLEQQQHGFSDSTPRAGSDRLQK